MKLEYRPRKLSWPNVNKIKKELERHVKQKVLAKQYGVSQQTISAIKNGRRWNYKNLKTKKKK